MPSERTYIAIDLKSFYASVECVERGLDPLTTNLVVADKSRTEKTICLAVTPTLKQYGIGGRARLFGLKMWSRKAPKLSLPPTLPSFYPILTLPFTRLKMGNWFLRSIATVVSIETYMVFCSIVRVASTNLASLVTNKVKKCGTLIVYKVPQIIGRNFPSRFRYAYHQIAIH